MTLLYQLVHCQFMCMV